ncbi:hypothetical protein GYMLUDRAFT_170264 [Collybiopsis luxurians FD-317 M1]|uniref:Uncharacterized protein n=1 Tax=Collybiopsis luxurians FD-317 M1 TaxID=944289 RepID=A0A0D0C8N8_9AGAR|nr:hypothetical protein GYMLUDRAFT_170264 [Collybiopsis luxurians FD-317 M1]
MFEHLHINFAKEGWRSSNKCDHFLQMVKWLSHQEKVASYNYYRSWLETVHNDELEGLGDAIWETIKASPVSKKSLNAQFDMVIVLDMDEAESSAVQGCRVGRLHIIFCLPQIVDYNGFLGPAPAEWPTEPMAYVMWLTCFKPSPHDDTGMYCVGPAKALTKAL